MDGIYHELSRRVEPAKLLGYLNFSDGRPDHRFQKLMADAFAFLTESGDRTPWRTIPAWLAQSCDELAASGSAAFRETDQSRGVVAAGLARLPAAYREHHTDLLARLPDSDLFNPFFLARACEAVLRQGAPWNEVDRLVDGGIHFLNDYVGYRPIAILETRPNTDYYPHEKVRPIPVYLNGAGVAPCRYADILRTALDLLGKTETRVLEEACFDPDKLDELAFDPRAHDHFHPLNKRPNVLFGEWDPHTIDNRGFFRRFVLRQMTLDTLLQWVNPTDNVDHPGTASERLFEASAVLAGTILMGAGVSGTGPNYYDSTTTLSKLVPRIARYRDGFYQRLLKALPGSHGERLREEASKRQQPFAGVRQYLNQAIASQRAAHLQDRRLAQLFAAMGYPQAARDRADIIPAPAVRFGTEIRIRQTEAGFASNRGAIGEAGRLLAEVSDLIRRGIDCGAIIDPWNILGYQGLFPIFPGREDTVRDPRAEDLIHTISRQFDLYARAIATASVAGNEADQNRLIKAMRDLAEWWDQFATITVDELPRIHGGERVDAAKHVARALAAWSRRDPSANDLAFWRQQRDGFTSPAAFAQVIEALIETSRSAASPTESLRAGQALLMTWLSENGTIPLDEPSAAFDELAEEWMHGVITTEGITELDRIRLVCRFFELLEANADDLWEPPELSLEIIEDRDEDEENEYASAYEGVTFRDSADDGEEGSVAGGEPAGMAIGFALEGEAEQLEDRLKFLLAVARLWRTASLPDLWLRADSNLREVLAGWLATARRNHARLSRLLDRIRDVPIPEPVGGHEGMIEFDRRRVLKGHLLDLGVATCVETGRAAQSLSALQMHAGELPTADRSGKLRRETPSSELSPPWERILIRLERAIGAGDVSNVRKELRGFAELFRHEPLLYCPPSDGGKPHEVLRAQTALHVLEDLLTRVPSLGLIRETFHLTRLARQMEWNSPPDGRRVSSFDQLFRTALLGVVESIVAAADEWRDAPVADGPLSGMLFQVAESFQEIWKEHSKSLRLSILESVTDEADWEGIRGFISAYGGDLFTVPFLGLSNMRGIMARGVAEWLDHEAEFGDLDRRPKLVEEWSEGRVDQTRITRAAEVVLQALVEHYDEYRDYNTTTTQSDYGENLHILLDFLRLKVRYDRMAWRLRPFALAHEVLCRRGHDALAARWRGVIEDRTRQQAEELLGELAFKENRYAIRLRTIRDRLEERFLLPLEIDRASAQVGPAADAARDGEGEDNPAFARLLAAVEPLSATVSGVGLEVPVWVRRLEEALRESRDEETTIPPPTAHPALDLEELRRQLAEWDRPLGE